MTQTAFIPPATTPGPQAAPQTAQPQQASTVERSEFNNHLEHAVKKVEKNKSHENTDPGIPAEPEPLTEVVDQNIKSTEPAPGNNVNGVVSLLLNNNIEQQNTEIVKTEEVKNLTRLLIPGDQQTLSVFQENEQPNGEISKFIDEQADDLPPKTFRQVTFSEHKLSIDLQVTTGQQPRPLNQQINIEENSALQQIQQIIADGDELKTVSIQGAVSGFTLQKTEQPSAVKNFHSDPSAKSPSLRQDIHGQFLETKLNLNNRDDNGANTKNSDSQNTKTPMQLNSAGTPESSPAPVDLQEGVDNFSSVLQASQPNAAQAAVKPVILPSGTVVYENRVIDQVIEHLQINRPVHDSKISIKLHPAELGELKIDIAMKEGNIKAHVIAQNQHVQDIVEKNMARLRTVLEDQGFTVGDITVSSDSDSVTDFNFFDQHLSQQDNQSPEMLNTNQQHSFTQALEDAVEGTGAIPNLSGVNITA
jgi:flagellar hook-length control protein FliK